MVKLFFSGYRLVIDGNIGKYDFGRWSAPFETPQPFTHTFTLHIGDGTKLAEICDRAVSFPSVCDVSLCRIHKTDAGWALVTGDHTSENRKILLCSPDYREMTLYQPFGQLPAEVTGREIALPFPMPSLIRCACESGMTLCGGLPLHASLVEKDGEGVIFLGHSGIGKSTQAKLWRDVLDADFIIGDRPALRRLDGRWLASGMPWDGKDAVYRQKTVPVRAMIALEQAGRNRIRRLSCQQAMAVMLNQAMMPMWDDDAMNGAYKLMAEAAKAIPFWHLECLPDGDAARLTYETIFQKHPSL